MKNAFILFKGGVETQEYFALELAKTFEQDGYEIFFYDLMDELRSFDGLTSFVKQQRTAGNRILMFTFNFNGLAGESYLYEVTGAGVTSFWQEHEIPCFNMVVDHPIYYHKYEEFLPQCYHQISIDRNHAAYVKRYLPEIAAADSIWTPDGFLPLGGTRLDTGGDALPIGQRPMKVSFTGNYTKPETFERYIAHLSREYRDFYHSILEEMIAHPEQELIELAERRLRAELETDGSILSDADLKSCYGNMIFIDLWVRFAYRGAVIRELVDHGIQVDLFGAGWEALECKHPENMLLHGGKTSKQCLEALAQSRISVNVMPWFKDGAHDRIFNSMLNGAVVCSDDSIYLKEILQDSEHLRYYSLNRLEEVPDMVQNLLSNPAHMQQLADRAAAEAQEKHTWKERAHTLEKMFDAILK